MANKIGPDDLVVVTGASAGVGRASVHAFAQRCARIALLARGADGLAGARTEADRLGAHAKAFEVDVADHRAVFEVAATIEKTMGPITVWVNNAFSSVFAPFWEIEPEEFRRTTEVSYLGYVWGTMAALKYMRPRDRGTIVHVGSALAYRGIPLQTAYCGSKHAIQGFHEALRCELLHEHSNVRTTMVQMPAVNTPQFSWLLSRLSRKAQPVPPIYQPEVAARAVLHAAEHAHRREYWVGSSTAATLAANAVAPGVLDRYLAKTGFASQQSSAPHPLNAPANLWEPADGPSGADFGTHGPFDSRSIRTDPQVWASRHHAVTGALTSLALTGAAALTQRKRRKGMR